MAAHEVLAGRRDLREHAGNVLEGVDPFWLGGAGVAAAVLGKVQHLAATGEQP